jgi:hypothetical protein
MQCDGKAATSRAVVRVETLDMAAVTELGRPAAWSTPVLLSVAISKSLSITEAAF